MDTLIAKGSHKLVSLNHSLKNGKKRYNINVFPYTKVQLGLDRETIVASCLSCRTNCLAKVYRNLETNTGKNFFLKSVLVEQ
jgi:glyceraldehyde-3-phosphate dehydrogenase/erythrose-4-phosphate dehydrogenase